MNLFQLGNFQLHSGETSDFKIDCDALDDSDLETIAYLLHLRLDPFGSVEGVPTGGLRLAETMRRYCREDSNQLLIVDDVFTTGGSIMEHRAGRHAIGAVIFARNPPYLWITPLFVML